MYLDFIFYPAKLELLFIYRFLLSSLQNSATRRKIKVFRAIFGCGKFSSKRTWKNQLPFFLILFS